MCLCAHLLPRLSYHFGYFFRRVLGAKFVELELQECQAQCIFDGLSVGVAMKALLEIDPTHGIDQLTVVTEPLQDARDGVGVKASKLSAPLQIADAAGRKRVAGDLPAT